MTDGTRSGQPLKSAPVQIVERIICGESEVGRLYFVRELTEKGWVEISKGYVHSTSAYAHLGRIVSQRNKTY